MVQCCLRPAVLSPQATVEGPSVPSTTTSDAFISTNVPEASSAEYATGSAPAAGIAESTTAPGPVAVSGDEMSSGQTLGSSTLQPVASDGLTPADSANSDPAVAAASHSSQDVAGTIASLLARAGSTASPSNGDPSQATASSPPDGASMQQDAGDPSSTATIASVNAGVSGQVDPAILSHTPDAVLTSHSGDTAGPFAVALGSSTVQAISVTGGDGGVIVGSATLSPGDPGQTVDGQYVSAGTNGLFVGIGTTVSSVVMTQGQASTVHPEAGGQLPASQLSSDQASAAAPPIVTASCNPVGSTSAGAAPVQTRNAASATLAQRFLCAMLTLVYTAIWMIG